MGRPTRTQFPSKKCCEVHTYASNTWYNLAIHKMMVRHTSLFLVHSENEGCEDQNLGAPTVCHQEVMGAGCTRYPSSCCTVVQHSEIGYFSTVMVGFHHRQGNKMTSTCASKCSEHKWITLSSEYNWIHVPTCLKPLQNACIILSFPMTICQSNAPTGCLIFDERLGAYTSRNNIFMFWFRKGILNQL